MMMSAASAPGRMAAILSEADREVGADGEDWATLDPKRKRASTLSAIGARVVPAAMEDDVAAVAFAEGLARIAVAMREAFPDNLLWDLDYLAASLWAHAAGDAEVLRAHAGKVAAVQRVFGRETVIGFAYVHDFTYGYDWAKWVGRSAEARIDVAPFDPRFVEAMLDRGEELREVIASGEDDKYPPLIGAGARNPFGFSREPADELRLHRWLAARGEVPVESWRVDAEPDPGRDFAALRVAGAEVLGLTARSFKKPPAPADESCP